MSGIHLFTLTIFLGFLVRHDGLFIVDNTYNFITVLENLRRDVSGGRLCFCTDYFLGFFNYI